MKKKTTKHVNEPQAIEQHPTPWELVEGALEAAQTELVIAQKEIRNANGNVYEDELAIDLDTMANTLYRLRRDASLRAQLAGVGIHRALKVQF